VALAVADLLTSVHRLIRARDRVTWRLVPLLAAAFIFLTLMTEFFEIWRFTRFTHISFYGLLFNMSEPLLAFLAASAVLPDEVPPEGLDLNTFYFRERAYVWGALFLGLLANVAINLLERPARLDLAIADNQRFWAEMVAMAILIGLPIWSRSRWIHAICIAGLLLIAQSGYAVWSIAGLPATVQPGT